MRINSKVKRDIKARAQMSRSSNDLFYLTIEDESSGLVIMQLKLDAQALADLISTRNTQAIDAEYYANPNIGKQHYVKNIQVDLTQFQTPILDSYETKRRQRDLKHIYDLAEELNPQWVADRGEYNSKLHSQNQYTVTLRRYE